MLGVAVFCGDYRCSHSTALAVDRWPDDVRLSDLEPQFVCQVCGKRGADVRLDFNWDKMPAGKRGVCLPKSGQRSDRSDLGGSDE